jgi:hypothetical protein
MEHDLSQQGNPRKEVQSVRYTKPELVLAGSAFATIQGNDKPNFMDADNNFPHPLNATEAAYQADE